MKRIQSYKTIAFLFLGFLAMVLTACEKEIISEREYPRIEILDEVLQDDFGVTFSGSFLTGASEPVIDKGFVWVFQKEFYFNPKTTPGIEDSRVSAGSGYVSESFMAHSDVDFIEGNTYYVRAYARTENHMVYSDGISFVSGFNKASAEILDFIPAQAMWRDTIMIRGKHLSFIEENLSVKFGTDEARILACTDSSIRVKVPDIWDQREQLISLDVYDESLQFSEPFRYIYPQVDDFYPKQGTHQDVITITGSNFPESKSNIIVSLGDSYVSILELHETHIVVSIPISVTEPQVLITTQIFGLTTTFPDPFVFVPE